MRARATKFMVHFAVNRLFILCTMVASKRVTSMVKPFFEKVGSPKFISAPMVEHSSLPWRLMVRSNGVDLAFTQMINAGSFVKSKKMREEVMDWLSYRHTNGNQEQQGLAMALDSNTIVQLAGDDVQTLVKAGMYIHNDVAAIDLNLGCPQKIAKRGHYGAYLLPERELVVQLLSGLVENLNCPVTAKVRVLSTEEETLSLCKAIEACGVSMLTVHGRDVTNMKNNIGPADWDIIRKVKQSVAIPVIANGGIGSYADALRCLEHTGADGVMSSEALLENPKLFSEEGDRNFRTDYVRSQLRSVREFLGLVQSYAEPAQHSQIARAHVFKMLLRFLNAPLNRDLQGKLNTAEFRHICVMVDTLEARLAAVGHDSDRALAAGLVASSGYYERHRAGAALVRAAEGRMAVAVRGAAAAAGAEGTEASARPKRTVMGGVSKGFSALSRKQQSIEAEL